MLYIERVGKQTVLASIALMAVVVAASAASFTFRKTVVPAPYGFIEYDRWTGAITACAVDEPQTLVLRLQQMLIAAGFSEKEVAEHMLKQWRDDGAVSSKDAKTCVRSY